MIDIGKILEKNKIKQEEFKQLNKEELDELSPAYLHTEEKFEWGFCRNSLHGQKKKLTARFIYFEGMNIANLTVSEKAIFNNCIFDNVKIKQCRLEDAIFVNCLFIDSSMIKNDLKNAFFINCTDLENTMIIDNILSYAIFVGSNLDIDELKKNENQIRDTLIEQVENEIQVETKVETKLEKEDVNMDKNSKVIKNETFTGQNITQELQNTIFENCDFIDCIIDPKINLGADTDFIRCRFENITFPLGKYNKVAFDQSGFQNVSFAGDFLRCNFARCFFENCDVLESANFYTCNFDFSDAYEKFAMYQEQFTDVIFNVPEDEKKEAAADLQSVIINENEDYQKVMQYIEPLYEYLKSTDQVLKEEMKELEDSAKIDDETVDQYLIGLTDSEFLEFFNRITTKRSQAVQKKTNSETDQPDKVVM